jgi:hypothetical protein
MLSLRLTRRSFEASCDLTRLVLAIVFLALLNL